MPRFPLACVLLLLTTLPVSANFGLFHRHIEAVRVSYYCVPLGYAAPPVYGPPTTPYEVTPAQPRLTPSPVPQPLPQTVAPPVQPASPPAPLPRNSATPLPAPASPTEQLPPLRSDPLSPAPPIMPRPQPMESIRNKVDDAYFNVYTNANGAGANNVERKVAIFWNLSKASLALQIDGQNRVLPPGSTQSFEVPRAFAWRVEGRAPESGRVPVEEIGVTIVIRR